MCAPSPKLVTGAGSLFGRAAIATHCLLVETAADGLVLVDTGFGIEDCRTMESRFGAEIMLAIGRARNDAAAAVRDEQHCALRQVEALGFAREDVRHVPLSHLDFDHAGGLVDFPAAHVHVMAAERAAAASASGFATLRYKPHQWAHLPKFVEYTPNSGEAWRGFAMVRELTGLPPEFLMLPLAGHTEGHACIAIDAPTGPVVYAGDAYFHRSSIGGKGRPAPHGMLAYEWLMAVDKQALPRNHAALAALARDPTAHVFCAHDPGEFPGALGPVAPKSN
jgi:glyoxylase-like metal-dependent hydrolase (beta-lactamase superfamily II)